MNPLIDREEESPVPPPPVEADLSDQTAVVPGEPPLSPRRAAMLLRIHSVVGLALVKANEQIEPLVVVFEKKAPPSVRPFIRAHASKILLTWALLSALFIFQTVLFNTHKAMPLEQLIAMKKEQAAHAALPVKAFQVGRFDYNDIIDELGTVKGSLEVKLSFESSGVVNRIKYREGDRYEKGALLFALQSDELDLRWRRAEAGASKARAQMKIARSKVTQQRKLFNMGIIPRTTLEDAKLEYEAAQADYDAGRLEAEEVNAQRKKSSIYAPSAGTLGEVNVEVGETITPNTLLGTHVGIDDVFVELGVGERDVAKIAVGQKAQVTVDAVPGKIFDGVVQNAAPMVSGNSRTATVRVAVANPARALLPGMFARVKVNVFSKKNAVIVASEAIQGTAAAPFVYVIRVPAKAPVSARAVADKASEPPPPAKLVQRAVKVGYRRADYAQIDEGLSEGELVALPESEPLKDGAAVQVLDVKSGK